MCAAQVEKCEWIGGRCTNHLFRAETYPLLPGNGHGVPFFARSRCVSRQYGSACFRLFPEKSPEEEGAWQFWQGNCHFSNKSNVLYLTRQGRQSLAPARIIIPSNIAARILWCCFSPSREHLVVLDTSGKRPFTVRIFFSTENRLHHVDSVCGYGRRVAGWRHHLADRNGHRTRQSQVLSCRPQSAGSV